MKIYAVNLTVGFAVLCFFSFNLWGQENAKGSPPNEVEADKAGSDWERYLLRAQEAYTKALNSGGQIAKDTKTWVQEDLKRLGAWEYKIVEIGESPVSALEDELQKLGDKRWECFHILERGTKTRFFLKRRKVSYLRSAPALDLLDLAPSLNRDK